MIADLHNDLPSRLLREKINGKIPDIDKIMNEDYGAENLALVVFAVFVPTDVVLRKNDVLYALAQLFCL
ncbi:MAG: hypothetical protein E7678_07670, partial [Ruminococcaceae bacterium]|nr:hypothetical protein [Oscillospiraceae bacterium]